VNHQPEGHFWTRLEASDLTAAYSDLQDLLRDCPDVVGFLQQFAALSAALVPRASCGVTVRRDHQIATVASSDEFAMLLGEIQYRHGQGPCLQALRTGERVKVPDLATDDRWGEYRLHALAAGARSSVSLPLIVNDTAIGAVSLYSRARNSFGKKDIRRAESLTLQAANALTLLLRYARPAEPGAALRGEDVEELRIELDEARDTLRTIRAGGFDALVIDTSSGAGRPAGLPAEGGAEPQEAAPARGGAGKVGHDDPAHRWYRLVSLESFAAGCPCGWVSPERDTAEEMLGDVDRHLEEARRAGTAGAELRPAAPES
jgi:putative methionine-R-sulfoxide reductase with GAF domain